MQVDGLDVLIELASGNGGADEALQRFSSHFGIPFAVAVAHLSGVPSTLETVAAALEGESDHSYDYAVDGSPGAQEACAADTLLIHQAPRGQEVAFAGIKRSCWAAIRLHGADKERLGFVLLAASPEVFADDAGLLRPALAITCQRIASEVERRRTEGVLQSIALAVSRSRSDLVFDEIVQLMATLVGVDIGFVAVFDRDRPGWLTGLSMYDNGSLLHDISYPMHGTPCETVVAQQFRSYPGRLQQSFPEDEDARIQCAESYAGYPISNSEGSPLGVVAVASRRPMEHVARVEALLKIFAVRAGAEVERLNARHALEASHASYRAIFEASEDAIFVHDWTTGEILDVNRKACEAYGYARDELVRLSIADISSGVPPYTADNALHHFELARTASCPTFEWHRRSKDGSLHWDEVRLKPATLAGQRRILAFTREITDRKEALDQLRMREEQYRTIFESSSDGLFIWDDQMRLVDVNPAGLGLYGFIRSAVIGRKLTDFTPPRYASDRIELLAQALRGSVVHVEATEEVRSDLSRFDADVRVVPFRHRGQAHSLAVVRDVSERRERELQVRRSESRLRATVEAAFDCVISMDQDGKIVEFNAAAERVFGYARSEVLGLPFADKLLPGRYREPYGAGLPHDKRLAESSRVGRLVETTALRRDGSEFPVELAISVAVVPEGSIFVAHLRDISQRRAAEARRMELEAQLRQAQKMEAIGQLTGGVAHDFNNILTSVMGYMVLAQERASSLGETQLSRHLEQAYGAAQRARELIAQMLAFARQQKGTSRTVRLTPLVERTLQLLRSMLPSTTKLDDSSLKQPRRPLDYVLADPIQLEQVLLNLCINARDALSDSGRIAVRVRRRQRLTAACASCRKQLGGDSWLCLEVEDTGSGISADVLDRIFDPFFSTKPPSRGSGMGLAMVHGIVHAHSGHVLVDTKPGRGSVFTVALPPCAPSPEERPAPQDRPARNSSARLSGRVLVIEDDAAVGDYLRQQLSSWGIQPLVFGMPDQALDALRDRADDIDLVLTDLTMPRLTGIDIAREVSARRPWLPVVLITGNEGALDQHAARASGIHCVVRKPIDPPELHAVLHSLLRRSTVPARPGRRARS